MEYLIRKSKREDSKEIANVVTVAWQESYRGIVNDEFLDNLPNTEEERAQKLYDNFDENNNNRYVLEVDNKVVGFVYSGITKDENLENCGEIFSIYIIAKYKGNGYGRKLIEQGIDVIKSLGCDKYIIGCLDGNISNEFYKHIGGKYINQRTFKLPNQELIENIYYYEM